MYCYLDPLQASKGEPLSSLFSTNGTLISASAAPHCEGLLRLGYVFGRVYILCIHSHARWSYPNRFSCCVPCLSSAIISLCWFWDRSDYQFTWSAYCQEFLFLALRFIRLHIPEAGVQVPEWRVTLLFYVMYRCGGNGCTRYLLTQHCWTSEFPAEERL